MGPSWRRAASSTHPIYLVNAGGIINVAAEYLQWDEAEARRRVEGIGARLADVLDLAAESHMAPHEAADRLARSIIAGTQVSALAA